MSPDPSSDVLCCNPLCMDRHASHLAGGPCQRSGCPCESFVPPHKPSGRPPAAPGARTVALIDDAIVGLNGALIVQPSVLTAGERQELALAISGLCRLGSAVSRRMA